MRKQAGRRNFYFRWAKLAVTGKVAIVEVIATLFAIVSGFLVFRFPTLQNVIGNLLWQIPLAMLLVLLIYGFFTAPYKIYKEKEQEANSLKMKLSEIENARANLTIEFDNMEPYCRKDPPNQGQIYWLRVKVTNSGKSVAKRCMGRLVQFIDGKGNPVEDHDPVQLHWVGTPWMPGPELFTLVDLQQCRSEFLDVLLTKPESPPRPLLFMGFQQSLRTDPVPPNIKKIIISVYGDNVDTYTKEYSITWVGNDYNDIRLS